MTLCAVCWPLIRFRMSQRPFLAWIWATFKACSSCPCRRPYGRRESLGRLTLDPPRASGQVCGVGGWLERDEVSGSLGKQPSMLPGSPTG